MPYCCRQILEVVGLSPNRRSPRMWRSRSLRMGQRLFEKVAAQPHLLTSRRAGHFLAFGLVDQPVLPLALPAVAAQRRCSANGRGAASRRFHADDVGLGRVELGGDLLECSPATDRRRRLACQLCPSACAGCKNSFFCAAVVPIFTQRPRMQDVFLDRRANPPHRVGREAKAAVGIRKQALPPASCRHCPAEISSRAAAHSRGTPS